MDSLKQHHLECKGRTDEKRKEQSGEQEWAEICQRNPIWRRRKKTSGEEYIRQLKAKSEGEEEEEKVGSRNRKNKEKRNGSGKTW